MKFPPILLLRGFIKPTLHAWAALLHEGLELDIAQWYSHCLTQVKPQVSSQHHKTKKNKKQNQQQKPFLPKEVNIENTTPFYFQLLPQFHEFAANNLMDCFSIPLGT